MTNTSCFTCSKLKGVHDNRTSGVSSYVAFKGRTIEVKTRKGNHMCAIDVKQGNKMGRNKKLSCFVVPGAGNGQLGATAAGGFHGHGQGVCYGAGTDTSQVSSVGLSSCPMRPASPVSMTRDICATLHTQCPAWGA
eukprot:1139640-Pelagomonas_calceolata.AAC.5